MDFKQLFKDPFVWIMLIWFAVTFFVFLIPQDYVGPFKMGYWDLYYIMFLQPPVMAAGAMFVIFILMGFKSQEGKFWLLMFIGILLWAVGEIVYYYFSMVAFVEAFPSFADVVYIAGYVVFGAGLIYKVLNTKVALTPAKVAWILGPILLIAIPTAIWVAYPAITAPDYSTLALCVSLTYPILDLVLIGLAMYILLAFFWGSYTPNGWIIIAIGVILMTIADIIFTAMNWQDIYYPILDMFYVGSYLAYAIGAIYQIKFIRSLMG